MRASLVAVETLRPFLTWTGYVALDAENMDAADLFTCFGPEGLAPPRSLSALIEEMLTALNAAPDASDAARLKVLAETLSASLAKVETALAKLETENR